MQKKYWIHDSWNNDEKLGKLIYDTDTKEFSIHIEEQFPEEKAPVIFSYFMQKGEYELPKEWAMRWIRGRIIPPNRQGLGLILKKLGTDVYDEFTMLTACNGRYAGDGCYLAEVDDFE